MLLADQSFLHVGGHASCLQIKLDGVLGLQHFLFASGGGDHAQSPIQVTELRCVLLILLLKDISQLAHIRVDNIEHSLLMRVCLW